MNLLNVFTFFLLFLSTLSSAVYAKRHHHHRRFRYQCPPGWGLYLSKTETEASSSDPSKCIKLIGDKGEYKKMALGPALEYCSEKLQTEIREKGGGDGVFPLEQPRLLRVTSPGQQNSLNRFFKRPEVAGQTEPTFFYSLPVQFRPEDGRWHWVASWNDADGNNFDVSEHLPRLEEGSWVLEKAERSLDEYKKMASQTGGPPLPAEKWCLYTYSLYGQDGPWNAQPCFDAGVVCESTPTRFDTGEEDDDDDDDDIETKTKIDKLIKEVGEVKKGLRQLPPIGFIYVQLSGERSPTELWPPSLVSFPQYQWTDVSDSFDSLFFRVAGKRAEAFGKVQEQQTVGGVGPFIDGVKRERCQLNGDRSGCLEGNDKLKNRNNCSVPVSHFLTSSVNVRNDDKFCSNDGWSAPLWTAFNYVSLSEAYDDVKAYADYHQYHLSSSSATATATEAGTAEVRPRNMAVKVWKRTG